MKLLVATALGLAMLAAAPTVASAATRASFAMTNDFNPTYLAPNISSASFATNTSNTYIGDDGFGPVLQVYSNVEGGGEASALASNSYVSYTLTAVSGLTLDIGSLRYFVGKGGSSDPRGYFIRSSLDNYATDIFSTLLPSGGAQAPVEKIVALSSAFASASSATFRFYVYAPTFANSVDFKTISFNSSVPEPETWALMLGGFGLVGALMRRRVLAPVHY